MKRMKTDLKNKKQKEKGKDRAKQTSLAFFLAPARESIEAQLKVEQFSRIFPRHYWSI